MLLSDNSAATMELKETQTAIIDGKLSEEAAEAGRKALSPPSVNELPFQNNAIDTENRFSKDEFVNSSNERI